MARSNPPPCLPLGAKPFGVCSAHAGTHVPGYFQHIRELVAIQTASSSGQSPAKTGPCRSFCGAISSSLSPSTSCDGPDMTSLAPPVDITNATFGRKTRLRWSLHHCGFFTTHTLVQFWMSLFIRLKPFLLRYSRVFRVLFLSVSGYLIVMMMTLVGTNRTAY